MNGSTTLTEVWEHIRQYAESGCRCPGCGQHVQIYWRSINAGQAASVVRLYRLHLKQPWAWVHLPTAIGRRSAEEAKLSYWGLVEEMGALRVDGGRPGMWRLTPKGVDWAARLIKVPRYVRVFDGHPWGAPINYSKSGKIRPDVGVLDALGTKFNYTLLMAGEG